MFFSNINVLVSLLLSMVFTFVFGNLVLMDNQALLSSSKILLTGIVALFSLSLLDRLLQRSDLGLVIICIVILISVRLNAYYLGIIFVPITAYEIYLRTKSLVGISCKNCHWLIVASVSGMLCGLIGLGTWSYTSFDMQSLSLAGLVAKDTMFHATIATSLRNFGVVSTLVNGPVGVDYHAFSHTIIAALSQWSHTSVLDTYGAATQIIFVPMLVSAVVYAALMAARQLQYGDSNWDVAEIALLWIGACLILYFGPVLLAPWGYWARYFFSESYLVGLTFFCFALPLLTKRTMSMMDAVVFVGLVAITAHTKGPVGLMLVGMSLVRFIFLSKPDHQQSQWLNNSLVLLASLTITLALVSGFANSASSSIAFELLQFPQQFGGVNPTLVEIGASDFWAIASWISSILLFSALHFWVSWLVLGFSWYHHSFRSLFFQPWTLMTGSVTIAGLLIFLLLNVNISGHTYFTLTAIFVASPVVLAKISQIGREKVNFNISTAAMFLLIPLVLTAYYSAKEIRAKSYLKRQHQLAKAPLPLAKALINIRDTDDPHSFWKLSQGVKPADGNPRPECSQYAFFFPALSERAWLGVITKGKECTHGFGYNYYKNPQEGKQQFQGFRAIIPPGTKIRTLLPQGN